VCSKMCRWTDAPFVVAVYDSRCYVTGRGSMPFFLYPAEERWRGMQRIGLLLVSIAAALVLASGVGVLNAIKPAEAAFPGQNGFIAYSSEPMGGPSEVFRIKPDGTRAKALTRGEVDRYAEVPVWSPDGKKIAYERLSEDFTGDGEIYLMNADGSGKVNLTKSPNRYEFSPAFYSSGRRIIFSASPVEGSNLALEQELYSISFDAAGNATGPPKRLTFNSYPDVSPVVSPDGKKIAFASARDENAENLGDQEIYVMNAGPEGPNNRPVQLTDNTNTASGEPINDESPDFSPDGRKIVYDSNSTGDTEIIVMRATDGRGKKNLTYNPASDSDPAFSPDGKMVAFISNRGQGGDSHVWKMWADGTKPTQVTKKTDYFDRSPDWQPLFSTEEPEEPEELLAGANWQMDETSGQMIDSSGNENHGTPTDVRQTGSKYGFDGSTSYVVVPDSDSLNPAEKDITLRARVKVTDVPMDDDSYDIVRKGLAGRKGGDYKMEIKRAADPTVGKLNCSFQGSGGTVNKVSRQDIVDGEWHTLECIKTSTSVVAKVDGRRGSTKAGSAGSISNPTNVLVGAKTAIPLDDTFDGSMDFVGIDIAR
jgi:Tol biopolymer transport system component